MARSTKTTRSSAKGTPAPAPAPTKRLGRPLGSKNRVTASTPTKTASVSRTMRAAPRRREALAAPKMNKAELEQQVIKLERTITRLRKQNAELKQSARMGAHEAAEAPPAPAGRTNRTPKRPTTPAARRKAKAAANLAADAPAPTTAAKKPARRSSKARTLRAAEPDAAQEEASLGDHEDKAAIED